METFGAQLQHKEIMVLEIPDNYQYMDAELVDELKDAVDLYFESRF